MKNLSKSFASFSWAMGLASARGLMAMREETKRTRFLKETEDILDSATSTTVDKLGKNLRETFQFGDDIQRKIIDSASSTVDIIKPGIAKVLGATKPNS